MEEKDRFCLSATEEDRASFNEILAELKRRRLVSQKLTANALILRLAKERIAQVWAELAIAK